VVKKDGKVYQDLLSVFEEAYFAKSEEDLCFTTLPISPCRSKIKPFVAQGPIATELRLPEFNSQII
jgi:hypothetical protein